MTRNELIDAFIEYHDTELIKAYSSDDTPVMAEINDDTVEITFYSPVAQLRLPTYRVDLEDFVPENFKSIILAILTGAFNEIDDFVERAIDMGIDAAEAHRYAMEDKEAIIDELRHLRGELPLDQLMDRHTSPATTGDLAPISGTLDINLRLDATGESLEGAPHDRWVIKGIFTTAYGIVEVKTDGEISDIPITGDDQSIHLITAGTIIAVGDDEELRFIINWTVGDHPETKAIVEASFHQILDDLRQEISQRKTPTGDINDLRMTLMEQLEPYIDNSIKSTVNTLIAEAFEKVHTLGTNQELTTSEQVHRLTEKNLLVESSHDKDDIAENIIAYVRNQLDYLPDGRNLAFEMKVAGIGQENMAVLAEELMDLASMNEYDNISDFIYNELDHIHSNTDWTVHRNLIDLMNEVETFMKES